MTYEKKVYYIDGFTITYALVPYDYINYHVNKNYDSWEEIVREKIFDNKNVFLNGWLIGRRVGVKDKVTNIRVCNRPSAYSGYKVTDIIQKYLSLEWEDYKTIKSKRGERKDPSYGLLRWDDELLEDIKYTKHTDPFELANDFFYHAMNVVRNTYYDMYRKKHNENSNLFNGHSNPYNLSDQTRHDIAQYLLKHKIKNYETN
jgi:hypothetical protein